MRYETYDGNGKLISVEETPCTIAEVKIEAERRITEQYPIWKQLNIIRLGGLPLTEMNAFIDAVRAKSNLLEVSKPCDITDSKHWQMAAPGKGD